VSVSQKPQDSFTAVAIGRPLPTSKQTSSGPIGVSIIRHGQLVSAAELLTQRVVAQFLSLAGHQWHRTYLAKSFPPLTLESSIHEIQTFIDRDCGRKDKNGKSLINPGGRHAYYRAIRSFFNWAYSPASELGLDAGKNPIRWVKPPQVPKRLMPAQDDKTLALLLSHVDNTRDKAILSLLIDSGGRLSEISNIREADIDWDKHLIKAIAKGNREVLMPFGKASEILLKDWLVEYSGSDGVIWGMNRAGIISMLRRLEKASGIKCDAHTFRRGFASILRRRGVDSLDIMRLGHWKSLRMVELYTESVSLEDSLAHYQPPSG
jgi:integrase